jgi:hypothetical protein
VFRHPVRYLYILARLASRSETRARKALGVMRSMTKTKSAFTLMLLLFITIGSYRLGKTVSDTYWKSKLETAIERVQPIIRIEEFSQSTSVDVINNEFIKGNLNRSTNFLQSRRADESRCFFLSKEVQFLGRLEELYPNNNRTEMWVDSTATNVDLPRCVVQP